jgi:hypothetical protein
MEETKQDYKKTYKLVLNNADTNSWTGTIGNATYHSIDFKKIMDYKDLDKTYEMSFMFNSQMSTSGTLTNGNMYTISIDLFKGYNTFSRRLLYNFNGILQLVNAFTTYVQDASTSRYLYAKDDDNGPITVNDLRDITSIRVSIMLPAGSGNLSAWSPNPGLNRYVCILTFKEI